MQRRGALVGAHSLERDDGIAAALGERLESGEFWTPDEFYFSIYDNYRHHITFHQVEPTCNHIAPCFVATTR